MHSKEEIVSLKKLREAREKFMSLLNMTTKESDWQKFFTECPYVLSESLPLKLRPSDINPLGRIGKSEPDFTFYPKDEKSPSFYGIIELKRPDSNLFSIPRKNVLKFSDSTQTAVAQSQVYASELEKELMAPDYNSITIGNNNYIFIISGLSREIANKITNNLLREQLKNLLPDGMKILTYDRLCEIFTSKVPAQVFHLTTLTKYEPVDNSNLKEDSNSKEEVSLSENLEKLLTSDSGTIKMLKDKGFGFITGNLEKNVFFHSNSLVGIQFDELHLGDTVTFEIIQTPKGIIGSNVQRA